MPSSRFRSAYASGEHTSAVLKSCLAQIDGLVAGQELGIVYFSRSLQDEADKILDSLRDVTGIEHWVGACGGEVIGGGRLLEPTAMAILLIPIEAGQFQLFDGMPDTDPSHGFGLVHATIEADMGNDLARWLLASDCGFYGAQVRDGLHINNALFAGSMSGVTFGPALTIHPIISRGLTALGPPRRITNMYGDVIAGVGGQDPITALRADAGEILLRDPVRLREHVVAGLLNHEEADGGGEPKIEFAAITDLDDYHRRLSLDRTLHATHVQFYRRDPTQGIENLERALGAAIETFRQPEAALYFMSARRGPRLFGTGHDELSAIRSIDRNMPIIGLVTDREVFASSDEYCSSVMLLIGRA